MAKLGRPSQQHLGRLIAEGRRRAAVKAAQRQAHAVSRRSSLIRSVEEEQKSGTRSRDSALLASFRSSARQAKHNLTASLARTADRIQAKTHVILDDATASVRLGGQFLIRTVLLGLLAVTGGTVLVAKAMVIAPARLAGSLASRSSGLTRNVGRGLGGMLSASLRAIARAFVTTLRAGRTVMRVQARHSMRLARRMARWLVSALSALGRSVKGLLTMLGNMLARLRDQIQDSIYYGIRKHLRAILVGAYASVAFAATVMLVFHLWPLADQTPSAPGVLAQKDSGRPSSAGKVRNEAKDRAQSAPSAELPDPRQSAGEAEDRAVVRLSGAITPQDKPEAPREDGDGSAVPVSDPAPSSSVAADIGGPQRENERSDSEPAWKTYAASQPVSAGRPQIAIIIDDLGMDQVGSRRAIALPSGVTLAFLPYAPNLGQLTRAARAGGHELLVHLPMEPNNHRNPGPQALLTGLAKEDLRNRISWNLEQFNGFVGINNHMGSRFTRHDSVMKEVMAVLKRRGLLFVDSRTTAETVGARLAAQSGVPFLERDIFLDNHQDFDLIMRQLGKVEREARKKGYAVAIGHPYDETIDALQAWVESLEAKGLALVPLTALLSDDGRPAGSKLASAAQP